VRSAFATVASVAQALAAFAWLSSMRESKIWQWPRLSEASRGLKKFRLAPSEGPPHFTITYNVRSHSSTRNALQARAV
jgi:hypothetical protein